MTSDAQPHDDATPEPAAAPPDPPNGRDTTPDPSADDATPRRLHPAKSFVDGFGVLRAAVIPIVITMAGQGFAVGVAIGVALAILGVGFGYLQWRTTVYWVDGDTLHFRSGLLARKEQSVPATRISALDTERGIVQRIFGIVAVQVQTAGGGEKAEIVLGAVTFAEAERLRHALGHRGSQAVRGSAPVPPGGAVPAGGDTNAPEGVAGHAATGPTFYSPDVAAEDAPIVYRMTPRELLVAALTSPSIAVVGAAAAALMSTANDVLPDSATSDLADQAGQLTVGVAIALVAVLVVVAVIVSIAGTALLYGGFTVTRDERRLRIRRGVITERVGTVPLNRVHGIRVIESPLRQALGYVAVEVEVAGYRGQDEVTRTIAPIVRRADLPEVLPQLVPGFSWPTESFARVPARARRRFLTVPLWWAALPAVALVVAPIGVGRVAAVVPIAVAVAFGRLAAKDAGWLRAGSQLAVRWRIFGRHTVLATEARLQRASTTTNPFQRRAALATFAVRLSSGRGASVKHLDDAVALELVRRTSHQAAHPRGGASGAPAGARPAAPASS